MRLSAVRKVVSPPFDSFQRGVERPKTKNKSILGKKLRNHRFAAEYK